VYGGGGGSGDAAYDTILNGNFDDLISNLLINIQDPIQACVLAVTCSLSTSAFIFPALKEKGWEEEPSGEAATTILLLQDLLVAPLLVILPLVVNVGPTDYSAIGFLTAKATIGFGSVVLVGSYFLQKVFSLVSQTRSSETFVALCLLVSVGMGEIARILGLTETAGECVL
jgi:Kef-type K+ transport system membrane component KefB